MIGKLEEARRFSAKSVTVHQQVSLSFISLLYFFTYLCYGRNTLLSSAFMGIGECLKDEQKNCEVDMVLEAIADALKDFSFMLYSHQVSEGKVECLKGFHIESWLILPTASLQESGGQSDPGVYY